MVENAYFVPRRAGVIRFGPGRRAELTDLHGGWSAVIEGVVADDLATVAREGTVSPRLRALVAGDALGALASWTEERWLPLTALAAVRLDGFNTLFLELTGTCNERCLHCYADSGPTVASALDRATCEAVIDDAAALGFQRVQFTGGDPLLCAFLPELVARAAQHPFAVREIYTNGLLLTAALLDRLAEHRPSFAISYYSHDAATHDRITRTPGSHRRTRRAIERVVARALPVRVSIVVVPDNQDQVAATMEDLRRLGVAQIATAASRAVGRGQAHAWTAPDAPVEDAHRGASTSGPSGVLAVTYDGDVVPCIFNRRCVLGRVGPARLSEVLGALASRPDPDPARSRPGRLPVADGGDALACAGCRATAAALRQVGA